MNDRQENQITMVDTTLDYMTTHASEYAGNAAIPPILTQAAAHRAQVTIYGTGQQQTSTGATTDKAEAKAALCYRTIEIIDPAAAYAVSIGNNTLLARLDYTASQLLTQRDDNLPPIILAIITTLQTLTAIPASGVLPADVTEIQALLATFQSASTAPRAIIVDKSTYTKLIDQEIRALLSLLSNQLDRQMTRYKSTNPQFYQGYISARIIIDN